MGTRAIYNEERRKPTPRDVTVRGIDESEGPGELKLGRGIRGVMGDKGPVYDISLEAAFDDAQRAVVFVVHKKNG
jgi:hypothetical protein